MMTIRRLGTRGISAGTALLAAVLALPGRTIAADAGPGFPAETQTVVSLNARHLLNSPLVKGNNLVPLIKGMMLRDPQAQAVLKDLGVDPFRDVNRVTFVTAGGNDADKSLLLVHGTFDPEKFETTAKKHPDHVKALKESGVTVYQVDFPGNNGKSVYVAVPDRKTLVAGQTKDHVAAAVGTRGKEPGKEFLDVLATTDRKKTLWFAGLFPDKVADNPFLEEEVKEALKKVKTYSGWVEVDAGVDLEVNLGAADADGAAKIEDLLKSNVEKGKNALQAFGNTKQLLPAKELLDSIKITTKGNVVTLKGAVSKDGIEKAMRPE